MILYWFSSVSWCCRLVPNTKTEDLKKQRSKSKHCNNSPRNKHRVQKFWFHFDGRLKQAYNVCICLFVVWCQFFDNIAFQLSHLKAVITLWKENRTICKKMFVFWTNLLHKFQISVHCYLRFEIWTQEFERLGLESLDYQWHLLTFFQPFWYLYQMYIYHMQHRLCHTDVRFCLRA